MTCECACLVCGGQMDRAKAHRGDRTCSPVCAELVRWLPCESCGWPARSNNASRKGHRPGYCVPEAFGPPPELAAWRQARAVQEQARERCSEARRRAREQRTARRRALTVQASPKRDLYRESHRDYARRVRGQRAAKLRAEGKSWLEVAVEVKLKSEGAAYNAAKRYGDPADVDRWPPGRKSVQVEGGVRDQPIATPVALGSCR